jgi:hypothetical protein
MDNNDKELTDLSSDIKKLSITKSPKLTPEEFKQFAELSKILEKNHPDNNQNSKCKRLRHNSIANEEDALSTTQWAEKVTEKKEPSLKKGRYS